MSETILTDVRVLGVDQRASNLDAKVAPPATVTLEVTPKQAEIATVAGEL